MRSVQQKSYDELQQELQSLQAQLQAAEAKLNSNSEVLSLPLLVPSCLPLDRHLA